MALVICLMLTILTFGSLHSQALPSGQLANVNDLLDPIQPLNAIAPDTSSTAYKNASEQLKHPDAETLHLLMLEVEQIGKLEKEEPHLSASNAFRVYRIHQAFEIVGTNATPLLSELKDEFLTGTSIGASAWGLIAIGENGWPILLQGLSSTNSGVQLASISMMYHASGTNALMAFPYLCDFATNRMKSTYFRRAAVEAIQEITVDPLTKISTLISVAQSDPDVSVRCIAIKAIGQTGIYNRSIKEFINEMKTNANEYIRVATVTAAQNLRRPSKP